MKNIRIIDSAANATFSVFHATDEEFATIFPDGSDIELIERVGEEAAGSVLTPVWSRPILKREVDWADGSVAQAQRDLFARHRQFVHAAQISTSASGAVPSASVRHQSPPRGLLKASFDT